MSAQGAVALLISQPVTAMVQTPIPSGIRGEVAKLRLIRGTTPPPYERCLQDPYVVEGAVSFNVDITRSIKADPSEIGSRVVRYSSSCPTAHGCFECSFQQEDRNRITNNLCSLRSDGENAFYAEVHYKDGHYLTARIQIVNRSDQSNNQFKFNFVCTELPCYKNLALQNIPPTPPPQSLTSEIDRDTNHVTLTFDNAGADNSPITGYAARYRTVSSDGVSLWSTYGGIISASGTTKQTTTSDATNTFGATTEASEIHVCATSAVGNSRYSETLFIGATPTATVADATDGASITIAAYNAAFLRSRTVTRYDYEYRFNTSTDWSTANTGALTTATTTQTLSPMTAGVYDFRIRGVLSDGSYTYWYMADNVAIS